MEKTKKNIIIIGSAGMLGRQLCRSLRARPQYKVIALTHKDCEITNRKSVFRLFRKFRPWLVIHSAAFRDVDGCQTHKDKAYNVNAQGTNNVALAARKNEAALIYISTDYVFCGRKKSPYKEKDTPRPLSVYGRSKLMGEEFIRSTSNKHIIIRTAWLFGKGGRNFADDILRRARNSRVLKIVNDKYSTPTYTKDLAEALIAIIDLMNSEKWANSYYGIYHITNSGFCSWFDYAKSIIKFAGLKKVKAQPINMRQINFAAARPIFSVLDNSKYIKLTHKPLRPWEDALREYIQCKNN